MHIKKTIPSEFNEVLHLSHDPQQLRVRYLMFLNMKSTKLNTLLLVKNKVKSMQDVKLVKKTKSCSEQK